ncbi:tellurite resistance TerB family protein [Methylorubrum populi]
MPFLLLVAVLIVGVLLWRLKNHYVIVRRTKFERNREGVERRSGSSLERFLATPLPYVSDVRLAAVILMIQIVRTGNPLTVSEKSRILAFMEHPLEMTSLASAFEEAWRYTEARRPFLLTAEPLLPLFREQLTEAERVEFVGMLTSVASAHSEISELQRVALTRFRHRLLVGHSVTVASGARRRG